jgi:hypothetical protein
MHDFPLDAVKLLFDASKAMIPVITGFLVFFAGSLKAIVKPQPPIDRDQVRRIAVVVILGLVALGLWTGAMPSSIISIEEKSLWWFRFGQWCARAGHISFFFSVAAALWFYVRHFLAASTFRGPT